MVTLFLLIWILQWLNKKKLLNFGIFWNLLDSFGIIIVQCSFFFQLTIHKSLSLTVNRLQRRFWPIKWTFFKRRWTKKSWKIKLDSTFKNPFEISNLQSKVMDKNQRGCMKMSKKMSISISFWILSVNFYWWHEISKGFLEVESSFIFQLFLVQSS